MTKKNWEDFWETVNAKKKKFSNTDLTFEPSNLILGKFHPDMLDKNKIYMLLSPGTDNP